MLYGYVKRMLNFCERITRRTSAPHYCYRAKELQLSAPENATEAAIVEEGVCVMGWEAGGRWWGHADVINPVGCASPFCAVLEENTRVGTVFIASAAAHRFRQPSSGDDRGPA